MKAINKGTSPAVFSRYEQALPYLGDRLGYNCSYCELNVSNSPEVEHVIPQANGGNILSWDNLLISCKQCNINKSNNNINRLNYIWPDEDNTLKAFLYKKPYFVCVNPMLSQAESLLAANLIDLCNLDKYPGGVKKPTEKDLRWKHRKDAWEKAELLLGMYANNQTQSYADLIAVTVTSFFSVYVEVFKPYPLLRNTVIAKAKGLDVTCFDLTWSYVAKGKIT